jgi:NitT/TauT family transport system ATP-binding protein
MPDIKNGASISLQSVSHQYRDSRLILDQLSLHIQEGEFVSILGPSGCGKSTLLRLLAALEHPTSGKLLFNSPQGRTIRGVVFQEPRLLPWRTVLDNVKLPLELKKTPSKTSRQEAMEALKRVSLEDSADKYPSQLSGGMKMRVAVARALVFQPNLLLLDEPFSALDEYARQALQEELRSLWQQSKMTVVFVTHSISEAVYLSNRSIIFPHRVGHAGSQIVIDQPIHLPLARSPDIRLDGHFSTEIKKLSQFLKLREKTKASS